MRQLKHLLSASFDRYRDVIQVARIQMFKANLQPCHMTYNNLYVHCEDSVLLKARLP